jgi:hypothetical protein
LIRDEKTLGFVDMNATRLVDLKPDPGGTYSKNPQGVDPAPLFSRSAAAFLLISASCSLTLLLRASLALSGWRNTSNKDACRFIRILQILLHVWLRLGQNLV